MILITGGGGFIGSNLVATLSQKLGSPKIVISDRFGIDDKWKNISKYLINQIIEPGQLEAFLEKNQDSIEYVFHLGAISSTTEKDVDLILKNNFSLSVQLWLWCTAHKVPFMYASSAATYGNGDKGFEDNAVPHKLAQLQPLNPYGWSKHLFDKWIISELSCKGQHPPQWSGLKFFNVFGPNETHKGSQSSLIAQMYPRIVRNEPAKLFKSHRDGIQDGDQSRDFIWIDDCIDVMLWLYENREISGLFNVGTGQARSFKDLITNIFWSLKREPEIEFVDTPLHLREQYQYYTQASMQKLKTAGYTKSFTSLEDGVHEYIANYLSKNNLYR